MLEIYQSDDLTVVVDNNVLVDLFELDKLHLLFSVFTKVLIPRNIYQEEVEKKVKDVLENYEFELADIETEVGLSTYKEILDNKKYRGLSIYDRVAISISKENYCYCNSNDKLIRKACLEYNVKFTGTLGVIGRAYKRGYLDNDQLTDVLSKISSDETTIHIKQEIIDEFLETILP